jgi:hypothetical protein
MVIGKIPMKAFIHALTLGFDRARSNQGKSNFRHELRPCILVLRSRSQEALLSSVACTHILCADAPTTDMYTLHWSSTEPCKKHTRSFAIHTNIHSSIPIRTKHNVHAPVKKFPSALPNALAL